MPEEAERHERRRDARFDREEDRQERAGSDEQADRLAGRPAGLVPVHDRVDGEHERCRHRDCARDVEPTGGRLAAVTREEHHGEHEDGDADRQVHEEDPVPAEHVREDSPEQNARGAATGEDEADDAHRLGALGRLGEEDHDQREGHNRDDRAAEALDGACADQELLRGGKTARERGEREDGDADQEEAAMPVQVAQPSAEQEEAAEREQIGVHDPGERGLREAEIVLDRRQGDVHDRRVEHDHEIAEAEDEEREPALAAVEAHAAP